MPRLLWKTSVFCAALEATEIAGSDCSVSQVFVSTREENFLNISVPNNKLAGEMGLRVRLLA